MSKRSFVLSALAVLAWGVNVTMASAADEVARLETYSKGGENRYFALSISPNVELPTPAGHDVIVLFDTSASQTGAFRAKALETLTQLLRDLQKGTLVKLFAVDLDASALNDTFVAADSEEIAKAIETLKRRPPLGATDMVKALSRAGEGFSSKSNRERSVIYIGDGQSGAHFVDSDTLRKSVGQLVERRVAVTSYSIGPRADNALLAALANQTGGLLVIDGDGATVKQVAAFLSGAAEGIVIWPTKATLPKQFASAYPTQVPPLRSDRDTVLIGALGKGTIPKTVDVAISGKACGKVVNLKWAIAVGAFNEDFSFLPELVASAKGNDGIGLATVGMAGLMESRRIINLAVEELAKLGGQAVATGNTDAAERLANEALRRDPNDPTARTVKKAIEKQRAAKPATKTVAAESKETPVQTTTKKTSKGVLKLEKFRNDQAPPPSSEEFPQDSGEIEASGTLLESTEQQDAVIRQMIQQEVENAIVSARDRMGTNAEGVEQDLKLELEKVMRAPELNEEIRAQLRDQLQTTIREARRQAVIQVEIEMEAQAAISARNERARMVLSLEREQEKVKQLMDRFNALMDEGRYELAEETAGEVAEINPNLPVAVSATLVARATHYHDDFMKVRVLRQIGVVDTLYQAELALIPFPDDEPIIYPAAPVWEELTQRRKKYASVDLKEIGPAEERISEALDEMTTLEFVETPLADVVDYLKDFHKIEIQLDTKALEDAGAGSDTPITKNLKGITLRSALRLMLGGLDLTYVVKDEVLLITTPEKAGSELVTKVYPVADLVLPIQQTGFQGGFGGLGGGQSGGGMMGAGGGGGGQFGGGGMGGGGMGGGMGGFGGGGGGGGFFNVPDEAKPVAKGSSTSLRTGLRAFTVKDDPKPRVGSKKLPAPTTKAAEKLQSAKKLTAIELNVPADADLNAAWYDYFAKHEGADDAQVRETVRKLMKDKNYSATIAMIQGALATGYAQPWMYEALGLALIVRGGDKAEIERALMSAVDFAESSEDLMYAAQYMARNGLEKRALSIFRQVSAAEPLRPEPLQYGLQLASRVNDLEGLQWASLGVLRQAWPSEKRELRDQANRVALAVLAQLQAEKRTKEAEDFAARLAQALVRDVLVKVTWTGDADVDILVEEPSGTVASLRNPRTTAGGMLLGDAASRGPSSKDGYSEYYVCPEAFTGTYKMQLRRVWGKITAGKVTIDVYNNFGTKKMQHNRQQIPLGEQDAVVVFDVVKGRRNEPIADHLVANAAANQLAVNRAILAQQLNNAGINNNALTQFALSRAALEGQFPIVRSGVGFQPVIITLPAGANMAVTGVISADRRYVRVTVLPLFSQIGSVTTFNIANGNTNVGPPPPQGGGGVGNGIGNQFPGAGGAGGGGGAGGVGGAAGAGGGVFNVPDDEKPAAKGTATSPRTGLRAFAVKDDLRLKANNSKLPAPTTKAAEKLKPDRQVSAIEIDVSPDADLNAAWYDYFAEHEDTDDAQVRETVRKLMKDKNHSATIALIQGALATGHAQPWMYEALGLALIVRGGDKAEIERALMSAVDFAESSEDLMYAAQYMARNGLEKRALSIFRQVSRAEPLRPEPLQYGLQLASRVNDLEALQWASLGVLRQAWPSEKRELRDQANRVALAVLAQLKAEKRTKEAEDFAARLAQALVRDVLVKVTWTGDADVDILVEEPSGTVASLRSPRTTAGGVILGDAASRGMAAKDGYSEYYVCPEAFTGTYKMQLRRVWGKITAGKVTIDVYNNFGTKKVQHNRQQIPLGEQDAMVVFDVVKGRRNEHIAEHLVANAAADQLNVNRAILAQQLNNAGLNNNALTNFALSRAALEGQFPIVRSGVGFQPVIITLPTGANMAVTGVISADRRYVRVTVLPLFSQIASVTTFNIGNGNTSVGPAPPTGPGPRPNPFDPNNPNGDPVPPPGPPGDPPGDNPADGDPQGNP